MKSASMSRFAFAGLLLVLLLPGLAVAQTAFSQIVVFGTSLSDPGNGFALPRLLGLDFPRQNTPPYSNPDLLNQQTLIPAAPYAVGGHHFSNGPTWIEQFAQARGLAADTRPAFQSSGAKATNYAVGSARASPLTVTANTLARQVAQFLTDSGGVAPPDALYVIEMGSNDVDDALLAGSIPSGLILVNNAISAIQFVTNELYARGARKFLIVNVPDLEKTPALAVLDALQPGAKQLAAFFTTTFNGLLGAQVVAPLTALAGSSVALLDAFALVDQVVANKAAYGLIDVTNHCILPALPAAPPYTCATPDTFLFWDGIHPTRAFHAIVAAEAAKVLSTAP